MAQNKILNIQPQYIPAAVGNLLNCNVTSVAGPVGFTMTQPYLVIKHVRILNSGGTTQTVTMYKGATGGSAGGTQVFFAAFQLAAGQFQDWYGQLRCDSGDFITGIATTVSTVIVEFDAEIGVS
jgi:hypothetical protein